MLEDIKMLLGIEGTEKDALLNLLIRKATTYILNYCKLDTLPDTLKDTTIDIVVINYNRIGTEGVVSESFEGVSSTYETDLPASIKRVLNRHRRLF